MTAWIAMASAVPVLASLYSQPALCLSSGQLLYSLNQYDNLPQTTNQDMFGQNIYHSSRPAEIMYSNKTKLNHYCLKALHYQNPIANLG